MKVWAETLVLIQSDDSPLVVFGTHASLFMLTQVSIARGIAKKLLGRAFYIKSSSLSGGPVQIPKGMTVASTVNVAELVLDTNVLPNESVNKMQDTKNATKLYRRYESSDEQMARHFEVEG